MTLNTTLNDASLHARRNNTTARSVRRPSPEKAHPGAGVLALLLVPLLAAIASAQSTGCPLVSDYTINGSTSLSTSCTKVTIPASTPITFSVDATAGTTVYFFFTLCPCSPGFAVLPGCVCSINSVDLNLSCPMFILPPIPVGVSGNVSFTIPFCPPFTTFATQAVVIDPACAGGFRMTQAYDVCCL